MHPLLDYDWIDVVKLCITLRSILFNTVTVIKIVILKIPPLNYIYVPHQSKSP